MSFWKKDKKEGRAEAEVLESVMSGTWEDFEAWIRETIEGNFIWKLRPPDTRANREMLVESIHDSMDRNSNLFPKGNAFLERWDP